MTVGSRSRVGVAVLVGLVLLGACNSTERNARGGPSAADVALEAAGSDAAAAAGADPATTGPETGAGATAVAGTSKPKVAGAAAKGGPAPVPGVSPEQLAHFRSLPMGKGVTKDVIKLGIQYADGAAYAAAAQALGGVSPNGPGVDDPKGIQNAVIDHINATGGIAGRRVEPVWHEVLASNAVTKEGRTRDAQQACATYTEDNQVFAIMGSGQWTEPNIIECAARSKTPYVDGFTSGTGIWLSDSKVHEISDYYYSLSMMTTQRRERAMVQALARQGFFAPGAKIGLITENSPYIKEGVETALKPGIKAAGGKVEAEVVYPDIIESPWQNYVLQFQTSGITHVIFSASTAESWPTLLFMRGAENQGYRPFYGISAVPVPWLQTNAPAQQLVKAMGVSWLPSRIDKEFPPVSPRDTTCRSLMKAKGYPERSGVSFCDFFWFLKDALERSTALTPAGLAGSAKGLGESFSSTITFAGRTRFVNGRHDGAYLVRNFAWDKSTSKMGYTSELYEHP